MEFSEFTFAFLEDIYSYVYVFGGWLIWTLIDDMFLDNKKENENVKIKRRDYFKNLIGIFLLIFFLQLIAKIWFVNTIIIGIAIISLIIACLIFILLKSKFDTVSKYYTLIPAFLFLSYLNANMKIAMIDENTELSTEFKIQLTNKKIILSSENMFLGRTKNYSFLLNKKSNKTIVYQNKDIFEFEITN